MKLTALLNLRQTPIGILIILSSVFMSTHSHANNTRLDISSILNTVGSTKLDITAKLPTEYTLEGETEAVELSATSIIQQQQKYYTLGGVRLKFTLPENTLEGAEITANPKFECKISAAGKLCTDFTYTATGTECDTLAADAPFDKTHEKLKTDYEFYWEPEKWDNTLDAQGTLTITFDNQDLPKKEIAFKLEKRELKATAVTGPVPAEALEGDDVAMLESMLWHLGISPSANPGARGVRLTDENKKVFNTGTPSVGLMMGRFNYINYSDIWVNSDGLTLKQKTNQSIRKEMHTGQYKGSITLDKLKKHWQDYYMAYTTYSTKAAYNFSDLTTAQKNAAEAVFDGTITYPNAAFSITATYDATQHSLVKDYKDFNRIDILKAMAGQESFGTQWGYNSKTYRMTVGGYDEAGSKGFNQIKNKYSYGGRSIGGDGTESSVTCTSVSAYDGSTSKVNHYDPAQNIIAKAAFMAGSEGDCGRSMNKAFATNGWKATHDKAGVVLKKMITGTTAEIVTGAHQDDALELLSKAIGAYNQGAGRFNGTDSWSEMLINLPRSLYQAEEATEVQKSKILAIKYVMETLKNQSADKPDQNVLPYRTYIWEGAAEVPENPATPEVEFKAAWCFKYGEEEWVAGKVFSKIKQGAADYSADGIPQTPVGRASCN
jgi:hypothetical protein